MRLTTSKELSEIQFGILSPDEIRKKAIIELNKQELLDPDGRGVAGGPLDHRLGAPTNRTRCGTCNLRRREGNTGCFGHFGYIELATPIYHPAYLKKIKKALNSVCDNCGRLKLSKEDRKKFWEREEKFIERQGFPSKEIAMEVNREARKIDECPYCGNEKQGKYVYDSSNKNFALRMKVSEEEVKEKKEELKRESKKIKKKRGNYYVYAYLNPKMVRDILAQIYEEELILDKEEKEARKKDVYLLGFHPEYARPEWTILTVLPVPPIPTRPPVYTSEGDRTEDHLTLVLREIIRINNQLRDKMKGGPSSLLNRLRRTLQKRIKILFGFHDLDKEIKISNVLIKGIMHRLSGKEGRFRGNLSGKRVDFSGRSVLSPDPNLSVDELGVPEKMAKGLLVPERVNKYNIDKLRKLIIRGPRKYPGALIVKEKTGPGEYRKTLLEIFKSKKRREKVAEELKPGDIVERTLMDGDPILFNRQPTLHKLSMMTHYAKVLPYDTLRLHLMTCPPYNADFDGDEMNVHLPRSYETRAEARTIMEVKRHIITPRYGGAIMGPIQDFITGAYLLTRAGTEIPRDKVMQILFQADIDTLPEKDGTISGKELVSELIPNKIFYRERFKKTLAEKGERETVVWDGNLKKGILDKRSIGSEKSENITQKVVEKWGDEKGKEFLNQLGASILKYLTDRGFSITLWDITKQKKVEEKVQEIIDEHIRKGKELVKNYRRGLLHSRPGERLEETFENKIVNTLSGAMSKVGDALIKKISTDSQFMVMTVTGARGGETNIQQVLGAVGQPVVRGERLSRGYSNRVLPHFKEGETGPKPKGFIENSFTEGMEPVEYFFHTTAGRDSLVDTAIRTATSGYFYRRLMSALRDSKIGYDGIARFLSGPIIQFKYGGDSISPEKSYHGAVADYENIFLELINERDEEDSSRKDWPSYYTSLTNLLEDTISEKCAERVESLFKEMRNQYEYVLTEEEATKFFERIIKKYQRAVLDPGEPIGTVTAQSISEPATQLTLETFHWAGVPGVDITTGLPRLQELFDARKHPDNPLITVYLEEPYRNEEEKAKKVFRKIHAIDIMSIIEGGGFLLQPQYRRVEIRLDKERLSELDLDVEKIVNKINDIKHTKVERDDYTLHVSPEEKNDSGTSLEEIYNEIKEITFKGIEGYGESQLRRSREGEYYILIQAEEVQPLLLIEGVDISRLLSTHIYECNKVFGLEATRNLIISEAKNVLDQYGLDVDPRHITYTTDAMLSGGKIEGIGRYGISGQKSSVLSRATFEETKGNLLEAGARGMKDELKGSTESVITGKIPPIGTGGVKIGYSLTPVKQNKDE